MYRVKNLRHVAYLLVFVLFLCASCWWWSARPREVLSTLQTLSTVFHLEDIDDAPQTVISEKQTQATESDQKCTHYTCFDVYRCDISDRNRIGVYVYPIRRYVDSSGILISSPFTEEYYQILEAITESPYYTPYPESACLFVPSIDLLSQNYVRLDETSQVLNSLPSWNDGRNHILFNMLPGSFPDYNTRIDLNTGKALIAGGGFDSWTFRHGFDVAIPVYSPYSALEKHHFHGGIHVSRNWVLVATQFDAMSTTSKRVLTELENAQEDSILIVNNRCSQDQHAGRNFTNVRCSVKRDMPISYPDILRNATFCLISRTAYLGSPLLSDALMSGCIPILAVDNYVLPFEDLIDWKSVSIRIHEINLPNIMEIIKSFSSHRIQQMQHQTQIVWRTYFKSIRKITLTTLEIINDRLNPHTIISKMDRNIESSPTRHSSLSLVSPKLSSRTTSGFTAVILSYERKILFEVIKRVVLAPSCVKVIVVWNSQKKNPPPPDKWPEINVPLKVIRSSANKLSNRFYPYSSIATEAILAIDDDIVMLNADELEFGYQVWREFPDRLVGFPSRVHRWDNHTRQWKYESEWTNDVSMVLTGAAFYHKYYNYLYSFVMPAEIRNWVDENMNCEDIAMNFIVANVTGKAPVKVTPRKKFKCPECSNNEMLSADVVRHLTERSVCINRFADAFGVMPLKTVEFRADPVLFKDSLPEKLKKFNDIGNL